MARRNTVNFLQIETGLDTALGVCADEAGQPWAERYRETLAAAKTFLNEATGRADHTYLEWRAHMKSRLLAAKHLWNRFNEIRDELGEYDVTAAVTGLVGYWHLTEIRPAAVALRDQVRKLDPDEVFEANEWHAELNGLLESLDAAVRSEERAMQDYRRIAPLRRQAIYRAQMTVDEFTAVRSDYKR